MLSCIVLQHVLGGQTDSVFNLSMQKNHFVSCRLNCDTVNRFIAF